MPAPDMPAPGGTPNVQMPTDPAAALHAGMPLQHSFQSAHAPQPAAVEPEPLVPVEAPQPVDASPPLDAPTPASVAWTPGIGLLLAVSAISWQFVAFYAREQLPVLESSGAPLTRFDQIVGSLPLAGSSIGAFIGIGLAAAALVVVLLGARRGLREPGLQGLVGALALVGVALTVGLPRIAG